MFKKDISDAETHTWIALIVTGVVFLQFYGRMTDGFGVVEHGAADLLGLYLRIIVTYIVLHTVVAIIFAIKRKKQAKDGNLVEKDERDIAISRKGDRYEFWLLSAGVQIIIFMMLFENMYPGDYVPPLSVTSPSGIFFALMGTVLIADIVKRIKMIAAYQK